MKKLRSDSTFSRISPILKDRVDSMLLSGSKYEDIQAAMAADGISISITNIGNYYNLHLKPEQWAAQERTAIVLNKLKTDAVTEATHKSIAQKVFEVISRPGVTTREISTLYNLVLKAEKINQDDRKLKMLEEQRDEAKRIAQQALEAGKGGKGITPATYNKLQEALKQL